MYKIHRTERNSNILACLTSEVREKMCVCVCVCVRGCWGWGDEMPHVQWHFSFFFKLENGLGNKSGMHKIKPVRAYYKARVHSQFEGNRIKNLTVTTQIWFLTFLLLLLNVGTKWSFGKCSKQLTSTTTSVLAKTVKTSAMPPFDIQIFPPFSRYVLPSSERVALVWIEAASLPLSTTATTTTKITN